MSYASLFNFRCWDLVGLDYLGNFLSSLRKCGGLLIWYRSHYSGQFYSINVFFRCKIDNLFKNVTKLVCECSALHEKEKRPKGVTTRTQFFLLVLISGMAYSVLPGYMFSMLTSFSWICWLAPKSVLVQQLGSGASGLGIASFGIDWSTISSYLGSPLASPWFATANIAAGFVLIMYVMTPLTYWFNVYNAKKFSLFSIKFFKGNGSLYDISSIVNSDFHLDREAYAKNGPLHLSTFFAITYGLGFATLPATIVHVLLFNGR